MLSLSEETIIDYLEYKISSKNENTDKFLLVGRDTDGCLIQSCNCKPFLESISSFNWQEYYLDYVKKDHTFTLQHIPNEYINRDICIALIKNNWANIKFIPEHLLDYEMCIHAVKESGMALEFVPNELKDINICSYAIETYAGAIKYIPSEMLTYDLCMSLVAKEPSSINYVPKNIKTHQFLREAIEKNIDIIAFLEPQIIADMLLNTDSEIKKTRKSR